MFRLVISYFVWHYSRGIADFFAISGNILWFIYHLFSIPVLTKTLFSPWRRENEAYVRGFSISGLFETLVVNTVMRVVGFFIRGFVIIFGLLLIAAVLFIEFAMLLTWILLPIVIIALVLSGIRLLFK